MKFAIEVANAAPNTPIHFIIYQVATTLINATDSPEAEWGYLMTDEKLQKVCSRLDYMKPRIVRLMDVAGWRYFKGVDTKGNPIVDFECAEVKMVCHRTH